MTHPLPHPALAQDIAARHRPLDAQAHATWSWRGFTDYGFARAYHSLPIVLAELAQVAADLPIVLERAPDGLAPAAVLTADPDAPGNAMVGDSGRWAGLYVPAILRAHPFSVRAGAEGAAHLHLDPDSPWLSATPGPRRLFTPDGAQSEAHAQLQRFLQGWQNARTAACAAAQALEAAGMLCPASSHPGLDASALEGFLIVDGGRLAGAAPDVLAQLNACGALELAFVQRSSLARMAHLRHLQGPARPKPAQTAGSAPQGLPPSPHQMRVTGFLDALAQDLQRDD